MKEDQKNKTSSSADKSFDLPKADILRGRINFQRLFEGSATVYSEKHLSLRFYTYSGEGYSCKMGFIVAKRLGKATERNYIKRILREAYRLHRHPLMTALNAASLGFHGALMAKTVKIDFETAEKEVVRLLSRVVDKLHAAFDL
ncbi:MAG TPA: ribonuclease P protein component [Balneolaceae bacterium]|nr:ribonuclease P protein component [Balneolaceae bacterium]